MTLRLKLKYCGPGCESEKETGASISQTNHCVHPSHNLNKLLPYPTRSQTILVIQAAYLRMCVSRIVSRMTCLPVHQRHLRRHRYEHSLCLQRNIHKPAILRGSPWSCLNHHMDLDTYPEHQVRLHRSQRRLSLRMWDLRPLLAPCKIRQYHFERSKCHGHSGDGLLLDGRIEADCEEFRSFIEQSHWAKVSAVICFSYLR
jgi:hypothetical protein